TAKTITLTAGQLELNTGGTATIKGPAAGLTVNGNNKSRVFQVDAGVTASLTGLTLTGGGLLNQRGATLTLTNCTLSGTTTSSNRGARAHYGAAALKERLHGRTTRSGDGGGNHSRGAAKPTDCTPSSTTASSNGGGLFNVSGGTLTLTNSTLNGNSAGKGGGL